MRVWNVETLRHAAGEAVSAEDTVVVSWADRDGSAVSRRSRRRTPPQLVMAVCLPAADAEERLRRLRELPGFVRLSSRDDQHPLDEDDPICVVRAVFAREPEAVAR